VYLFGSRARGTHRAGSDIDLAIVGANLTFDHQLNLATALENLEFLETFDVVLLDDALTPALKQRIEKEGVEIWKK
jgi:predicted nucleotidyltransferase